MSKTGKLIIALISVLVIAGGVWAVVAMTNRPDTTSTEQSTPNTTQDKQSQSADTQTQPDATAIITFNGNAFTPSTVEVSSGSQIKVTNDSMDVIEFASDPHPTHTINPELNTGDIEPSGSKTITVTKTGTWGYHDHYNPSMRGSVIVK